jgi:hypothetical protein
VELDDIVFLVVDGNDDRKLDIRHLFSVNNMSFLILNVNGHRLAEGSTLESVMQDNGEAIVSESLSL